MIHFTPAQVQSLKSLAATSAIVVVGNPDEDTDCLVSCRDALGHRRFLTVFSDGEVAISHDDNVVWPAGFARPPAKVA